MLIPTHPHDEKTRLEALRSLGILDTEAEVIFDDIVKLGSFITGCPISLISLVDADRQWFKARQGLDSQETARDISFCAHAILQDDIFVVENASQDARFADNPLVQGDPSIRFYAGKPLITKNGHRIGTFCAIDKKPRRLSPEKIELINCLARQTVYLIEQRKQVLILEMTRKNSQTLFEQSPLLITSMGGPDHIFEYINAPNTKLLEDKDAIGKPFAKVQPEAQITGLQQVLDDVYTSGQTQVLKNASFCIDDEQCHFDFVLAPRVGMDGKIDGVMGIIDDITARKQLELKLQDYSALRELKLKKMAHLLEQVPIHIALVEGPDHRLTYANRLYRDVFLENQPFEGKTLVQLFPEVVRQGFKTLLDEVYRTGKSMNGEEVFFELTTRSGAIREFYFDFLYEAVKNSQGNITGMLIAVADVTEPVRARAEIMKKVDELKSEKDLRERFVATLSHDLQNPLMAAKVGAERLVLKDRDSATTRKISQRIMDNISRTQRMVHNLLDANRLKAGEGLPVNREPCSLDSIVRETVDSLRESSRMPIDYVAPQSPVVGLYDDDGIRRIVENLVGNGLKYGDSDRPVTVQVEPQHDRVDLKVHNHGSVIPQEHLEGLFETYRRLDSTAHQAGWGIGLSLVKGITEAHQGRVWAESCSTAGTTFIVQLPMMTETHNSA